MFKILFFAPLAAKMMKHEKMNKSEKMKKWKTHDLKMMKKWYLKWKNDKINHKKMMNAMITKMKKWKNYFDLAQSVAASFS